MVDQKDIYQAAHLLIQQHGANAGDESVKMLHYFLKTGDVKASSVWLQIGSAIEDLRMVSASTRKH